MDGLYRCSEGDILHKTFITLRKDYCPNESIESMPQVEMALSWFVSDLTTTKENSLCQAVKRARGEACNSSSLQPRQLMRGSNVMLERIQGHEGCIERYNIDN
jgi:hypothetical protein